jgi:hypothetical protein
MLRLQMLPAARGDCLWIEYGTLPHSGIIVIDGGLKETADVLLARMEMARRERQTRTLEVELIVVTHIDNDHILGIIEVLRAERSWLHVRDIWFNGRPQLEELATAPAIDAESHLLGPAEGEELSDLLAGRALPWNASPLWQRRAVMIPESGELPSMTLEHGLKLTVLGPTRKRLERMWKVWKDVVDGSDEKRAAAEVDDGLLGHGDVWPPVWRDGEGKDSSAANGSSIMLLAEYEGQALLLAGDGYASDLTDAIRRLCGAGSGSLGSLPLAAFKLSHHGSANNLTRALLETMSCGRYLISTDGSGHGHPDHQALLRILRYSREAPQLLFNHLSRTTRPWRDQKRDVVRGDFQDYGSRFPVDPLEGLILEWQ